MNGKVAIITYDPKTKNPDSKKVVLGKYMSAGQSREISLKQVPLLENDEEIKITMPEEDEKSLSDMKVPALKNLAKEMEIPGYSSMKRDKLLEELSLYFPA